MRAVFALTLGACVAVTACRAKAAVTRDSSHAAETVISRALDSCSLTPTGPDTTAVAHNEARNAKRLTGHMVSFDGFSLFIPDGAPAPSTDASSLSLRGWTVCADCHLSVTVHPDSGKSLEQRIAARVAEQKRIDSVNADPKTPGMEFDDMFGRPRPFRGRAGRGYSINDGCGDCVSVTVLFGRPPRIASINYGFDDTVRMPWRRSCEMAVLARSFAWSED